jgi:hypothetical protein
MTTCTHTGYVCDSIRICEEVGCGIPIFSGFSIDFESFCSEHFALTEVEYEEFGETCYWTDWEVTDQCYDCAPGCECMTEAIALKILDDEKNLEPHVELPTSIFLVAGHTVQAVGKAHADSIYYTNPDDERVDNGLKV